MIIMGVDFGDARTGLALCDNTAYIAYGAGCINLAGLDKIASEVTAAAQKAKAELIVVGNPINMDGSEGARSIRCRKFASRLAELSGIPVELYDERLTTVSAHQILSESNVRGKKRKAAVDELSATIILQAYLDNKSFREKA